MAGESMFAPNRRSVSARGVDRVMDTFFAAHGVQESARPAGKPAQLASEDDPKQLKKALLGLIEKSKNIIATLEETLNKL